MATGAVVVFNRKGTVFHRYCGRVYLATMLVLNISALSIYQLWGHFGPFHVAAVISLFTVMMGVIVAWRAWTSIVMRRIYFRQTATRVKIATGPIWRMVRSRRWMNTSTGCNKTVSMGILCSMRLSTRSPSRQSVLPATCESTRAVPRLKWETSIFRRCYNERGPRRNRCIC